MSGKLPPGRYAVAYHITCYNKGGLQNAITSMDTINKIQIYFNNIDNLNKGLIGEGCDVF